MNVTPKIYRITAHLLMLASVGLLLMASIACDGPVEFKHTTRFNSILNTVGKFDAAAGEPAPADAEVPIIYGVEVDLAAQNPELKDYADRGLFTSITVDRVSYTISQNTLTTDVEDIQIAIGPPETRDPNAEDTYLIAAIEKIEAGATPMGEATLYPENVAMVKEKVQTLKFGLASGSIISLDEGDTIPDGNAVIDLELFLTLEADPL